MHSDSLWHAPDGWLVALRALLPYLARLYHRATHLGKWEILAAAREDWFAPNFSVAHRYCDACAICQDHNVGKQTKITLGAHPSLWRPSVNLQTEFIQFKRCQKYEYVLVVVCTISRWTEAYPWAKADTTTLAKKLLTGFIPQFGIPWTMNSDRAPILLAKCFN